MLVVCYSLPPQSLEADRHYCKTCQPFDGQFVGPVIIRMMKNAKIVLFEKLHKGLQIPFRIHLYGNFMSTLPQNIFEVLLHSNFLTRERTCCQEKTQKIVHTGLFYHLTIFHLQPPIR